MARPNVTVLVDDQSFVVPYTESGSLTRGGMPSFGGLITALGYTAERKVGVMQVDSVNDLIARMNSSEPCTSSKDAVAGPNTTPGGFPTAITGEDLTAFPFYHDLGITAMAGTTFSGGTFARWPLGPTGSWKSEFWAAHNYLQYGGVLLVGGTGSIENLSISSSNTPLHNKRIPLDIVFAATGDVNNVTSASNISTTREDCIAVCPADGSDPDSVSVATGQNADEFNVSVFGVKKHLDISRGLRSDALDDLISTPIAADIAGCMARTDRLADPWWSPAGLKRGQILDTVRLDVNPSEAQQDSMYDNKINPTITFSGEGTVLWGDKTLATPSSTLSRINVSRLFIYLKKTIGAAARDILFELNDWETRTSFINAVTPMLENVRARRGVYDYRVVCDETNNTPSIIDTNQFVADIYIKPSKSINFIRIRFTNKNTEDSLE